MAKRKAKRAPARRRKAGPILPGHRLEEGIAVYVEAGKVKVGRPLAEGDQLNMGEREEYVAGQRVALADAQGWIDAAVLHRK